MNYAEDVLVLASAITVIFFFMELFSMFEF